MRRSAYAAFCCVLLACWVATVPVAAWSKTTELSRGTVVYPPAPASWAVFAYDPETRVWTELKDVSWRQVDTLNHASLIIEATAPQATAASTYRVVLQVIGSPVEVFMTPDLTQRLIAGETTTIRINLF